MREKSKIVTMIIALLISIALWFYVVTVKNPETEATITNIPVTFSGMEELNEDRDLIVTSGLDTTVTLRLSGRRSEISKLSEDNITLTVDLTRIARAQTYSMNYTIDYPPEVSASLVTESMSPRITSGLSPTSSRASAPPSTPIRAGRNSWM